MRSVNPRVVGLSQQGNAQGSYVEGNTMLTATSPKCDNLFTVLAVVGFVSMHEAAANVDKLMEMERLPGLLARFCPSFPEAVFRQVVADLSDAAIDNSLKDLHDRLHAEYDRVHAALQD